MTVDASVRARVLGIETKFEPKSPTGALQLPQQIGVFAQGNTASTYPATKFRATRAVDVANLLGYGSPAHLIARELLPENGDGVGSIPVWFFPMADQGGATAAAGTITPSGTPTASTTWKVGINGIYSNEFSVAASASVAVRVASIVAAVNAILHMPMNAVDGATVANFTSKWKGASANDLKIEVVQVSGSSAAGNIWTVVQPTGGATNPGIQPFLDQVGSQWITLGLNALNLSDTTTLDTISTWGEGRYGEQVKKPVAMFTGTNIASVASAIAVSDARKTDRINGQIPAPGSKNLPFVIAARGLARIAKRADNDPAFDYAGLQLTGILPGTDGEQWTFAQRDQALKAGSSTVEVEDGVVELSDTVTFYHPTGETDPAYRYLVDIVRLQNVTFNFEQEFSKDEWNGAPFIPDGQATTNRNARKPKSVKTAAFSVLDRLGLAAILADVEASKKLVTVTQSTTNPKRWDLGVPVYLSGNSNVRSVTLRWGFYYG